MLNQRNSFWDAAGYNTSLAHKEEEEGATKKKKKKETPEEKVRKENDRRLLEVEKKFFKEVQLNHFGERDDGNPRNQQEYQSAQLPMLKKLYPRLAECPAISLVSVLDDLEGSFKRMFVGLAHHPVFKHADKSRKSFTFSGSGWWVSPDGKSIQIPKLGTDKKPDGRIVSKPCVVKMRGGRAPVGKLVRATVYERAGHWYVSVVAVQEDVVKVPKLSNPVGIDMGVTKSLALSDGTSSYFIELPVATERERRQIKRLAWKVSHCKSDSKRKAKAQLRLNRKRNHIQDRVQNARHHATTGIVKDHGLVVIENLQTSSMSKSAKGTKTKPGKNVKAKSGLNRSILEQGWGETRRQLEYKSQWNGNVLLAVPPAYTSLRCSNCGCTDKKNRRSQSHFQCVNCGLTMNADSQAARNILTIGKMVMLPAPSGEVKLGYDPTQVSVLCDPRTHAVVFGSASGSVMPNSKQVLEHSQCSETFESFRERSSQVLVLVGPEIEGARKKVRKSLYGKAKEQAPSESNAE